MDRHTMKKRARTLAVLAAVAALWSCSEDDAWLGDVPSKPGVTSNGDASVEASGGEDADAGMCVATTCPANLTTCPSDFGPTYKCAVDLRRDPKHCGACGKECLTFEPIHMTSRCVEGACALECLSLPRYVFPDSEAPTKFVNCNGLLDDGCEIDVFSDPQNCGACGNACAAGKRCIDGQCGCAPGLEDCDGFCVDVATNDLHCSACGKSCDPPKTPCDPMPANADYGCNGKKCEQLKCQFGWADCNGDLGLGCASNGCETPLNEPNNCGACGNVCKPNEECRNEAFGFECRPKCETSGKVTCPFGGCADTLNDPDHCGGCGLACPIAGPRQQRACKKGICEVVCAEGFGDCNGDPTDGCETDLRVHPSHCGACGASCDLASGQPCVEGKCLVEPCKDKVIK